MHLSDRRACRIKNQPLPNKQLLLEEDLLPLLPVNSSTGSMSITQMQVGAGGLNTGVHMWIPCFQKLHTLDAVSTSTSQAVHVETTSWHAYMPCLQWW